MLLRDYQYKFVNDIRAAFRAGHRRVLGQLPTGGGKTVVASYMIKNSNGVAWFNCHRRELINQTSQAFTDFNIDHGIIQGKNSRDIHSDILINSVQSLARRMDKLCPPKIIIWDECHHLGAGQWKNIFLRYPESFHVGLSATPCRLDGQGLGEFFDVLIQGPTTSELIEMGYLSKYKYYAPTDIDTKTIRLSMGDYGRDETVEIIEKNKIIGSVVSEYKNICEGRQMIIFAPSIDISIKTAKDFSKHGFKSAHIDGRTPINLRNELINDFARGKIKILSNVDLFGEGFNVPSIEAVAMLRPTISTGLYLQMVGRALRPSDKHAIILDHVGNYKRHGLPDDSREWSLDSKKRKRRDAEKITPTRVCMECFSVSRPATSCEYCGAIYPIKNLQIENVEGKLTEIIKTEKRREVGKARTLAELIQIGRERGYKNPTYWARMVLRGRK